MYFLMFGTFPRLWHIWRSSLWLDLYLSPNPEVVQRSPCVTVFPHPNVLDLLKYIKCFNYQKLMNVSVANVALTARPAQMLIGVFSEQKCILLTRKMGKKKRNVWKGNTMPVRSSRSEFQASLVSSVGAFPALVLALNFETHKPNQCGSCCQFHPPAQPQHSCTCKPLLEILSGTRQSNILQFFYYKKWSFWNHFFQIYLLDLQ